MKYEKHLGCLTKKGMDSLLLLVRDSKKMIKKDFYAIDLMEIMQTIGDVLSLEETEVGYTMKSGIWNITLCMQEMIAEADIDGDGNVNYEEFVGMIFKGVMVRHVSSFDTYLRFCSLLSDHIQRRKRKLKELFK